MDGVRVDWEDSRIGHALHHERRRRNTLQVIGELLAGLKEGRRDDRERLVCMNLGVAIEDMATAALVLERARARGRGLKLPL